MKKAKYGLVVILIGLISLLVYQNLDHLRETHTFHIDLAFFGEYLLPRISNGAYYTGFFVLGLLVSYFFSLSDRFKNRQIIKNLTESVDSHRGVISSLEIELNAVRGRKMESAAEAQGPRSSQEAVS